MTLPSYLRLLRRNWTWVSLFTLVGISAALALALSVTPKFVAVSEIFLSTPRFGNVSTPDNSPFLADNFSQQRARSYVHLATREDLARRVIDRLGIDMRPADLAAATTAWTPPDTVLIDVAVESTSASEAKVLADAVTAELSADIQALESRSGQLIPIVQPVVTQPALTPHAPSQPRVYLYLLFGASIGFLVGVTAAYRFGRKHIESTKVEEFTARPVLGTVVSGPPASELDENRWDVVMNNLGFEVAHSGDRVLAITNVGVAENSSQTAYELASACANAGSRVVLISARSNRQQHNSSEHAQASLASIVAGEISLDDVIASAGDERLLVIGGSGPDNVAPLFQSKRFRATVGGLRSCFDLVILDVPAFPQLAVTTSLADSVDSVVFVIADTGVDTGDLSSAMRRLAKGQMRLVGSILTSHSFRRSDSVSDKHVASSRERT
jgi:capsular polysaccharide biosynthesis protein